MAAINVGKVSITFGGDYDSSKQYRELTCVLYGGVGWVSKQRVPTGIAPVENSAYWQKMSERGAQGPAGQSFVDKTLVKIVNNLTDGGSDAVLSAEQGKVINGKFEDIDTTLYDKEHIDTTIIEKVGTSSAQYDTVIDTGISVLPPYRVIAETELVYTSTSADSTFVSLNFHDVNTGSRSDIKHVKGSAGAVIEKGTVIFESSAPTALPSVSTISIGSRYTGTIKVVFNYGITYGLVTKVAENTERIAELSGTSENVLSIHKDQLLRARQVGYVNTTKDAAAFYTPKTLAFMHMSDSHDVKPNKRAIEMLNYLGANGHVKFLMHTGDILKDPKYTSSESWSEIVAAAQYPVFVTAGNHDVGNWETDITKMRTSEQFYNYFVAPQIGSWGLKADGYGSPHIDGKNYFFTDFTDEKVRFIVTCEYEIPTDPAIQATEYATGRGARWISQEQTNWLIDTLKNTPAGYGVILVHHAPEGMIGNDVNPFNSAFRNEQNTQQTFQYRDGSAYTAFFADIIQAFIDRASVSYQVTQAAAAYNNTLNVVADFRSVPSDVEFICHVSGHVHTDNISHIATHPQQLELNINCSSTSSSNQRSEVQLIEGTSFEDCINVYGVNRKFGEIYVLRIGADYSGVGERKDMYTFSYR